MLAVTMLGQLLGHRESPLFLPLGHPCDPPSTNALFYRALHSLDPSLSPRVSPWEQAGPVLGWPCIPGPPCICSASALNIHDPFKGRSDDSSEYPDSIVVTGVT